MKKTAKVQNGHSSNGHSNGNGAASASASAAQTTSSSAAPGKKIQKHGTIEHVGWAWPLLTGVAMIVLPFCIYWCWICCEYNQGKMLLPKSFAPADIADWWTNDVWNRIVQHAYPSARAWAIYGIWVTFQAVLILILPGYVGEGLPVIDGSNQGKKLKYKYNGQFAFFISLIAVAALHISGTFRLTELYDLFGPLQTVCELYTAGLIAALYMGGWLLGTLERRTDSLVYDYFMGPMLNPRVKIFGAEFDFKWFHELRPGIMQWFFTTVALALKQYETYGTVSTPMILICFYHLCFVNACYKGEQCVPMSMDIIYEKFGWMLCWLDLVVVPFIFPLQAYYLYKIGPFEHSWYITLALASMHVLGYWMFDTANSQKDYFREEQSAGKQHIPKGFPHLPWGKLENPKYLQTERGTKLLISGWWAHARHMNYLGDILMSWAWGLTCGVSSYFPFAYTTYLTPLLLHRERRDHLECQRKYGKDWEKYCKIVPYRLIPYIY